MFDKRVEMMKKSGKKLFLKICVLSLVTALSVQLFPRKAEADANATGEIATWSGFRKAAASFTFDDGAPSHVTDVGPIFKKYGYKATFFLVCNWNPNWSGFQGLADEGHEIGSHSNTHSNNMSGEEVSSKNYIKYKINQKYGVLSVAYPNSNVPNESAVLQNYIVGRIFNGSWMGLADDMGKDGPSNWAKVPAYLTGSEATVKSTNDFTSKMQKVIQSNGWVAFVTHGIQGKSNGNATYSPTDLNAIDGALNWAQENDKDIWVAPMGHVAMYIKERKASKFEVNSTDDLSIKCMLKHNIVDNVSKYDYPLSVRVSLPEGFDKVEVKQDESILDSRTDSGYVYFDAVPNGGEIVINKVVVSSEARLYKNGGGSVNYNTVSGAFAAAQEGDTITLLGNVETEDTLTVSLNSVTLDLNGYGIKANSTEENPFSVITIESDGNLTITDSGNDADHTHYYIVRDSDTNGAGLATVCDKDTYDLFGGTKGTFTGGYITGGRGTKDTNGSEEFYGGGILVKDTSSGGTLTMNGGTIIGNKASRGGGIFGCQASLSMNNCAVIGNAAYYDDEAYSGGFGGGMYLDKVSLKLKNSRICGNTGGSSGGGAEICDSSIETENTIISGNKAKIYGGGVHIEQNSEESVFNMNGGEICNNIVWNDMENDGGGVYVSSGKFNMNGGRICHNESRGKTNGDGGGVFLLGNDSVEFTVSGNVTITDNKNINGPDNVFLDHVEDIKNITVKGRLEKESLIGVTTRDNETRTFTSGLFGRGSDSNFFSDREDCVVGLDEKNEAALFETVNITFNANDGSGARTVQKVKKGFEVALSDNSFKAPSGSCFDGWATAVSGKKVYDDGEVVKLTADTTLYARWTYTVTVNNGTFSGTGKYVKGETVEIKADAPESGKVFDKWTSEDGVDFDNENSASTTFTMPERNVTVTASYRDRKGDDPEKKPDKVPVTGAGETYAAPNDNFAPITSSGKVSKLVLDFTKVAESGINPEGLKMTVISGSKFTTKENLKDRKSFTADKGIKVKVNKKTLIPTITCKKSGSVTLILEGDKTYKIEFEVQKPKAQKSAKKLAKGSGTVSKTIRDLFGTDIDAGELKILKQKHSQATLSGNTLVVNPEVKDTIKVRYKYLNKKYGITIKVK